MLVAEHRPRSLKWFHAGPLLFGDWGTSRLYVLGLAFYYTGHASPLYMTVMAAIMAAVAWAYTIICRCFPEGGGVYTASRLLSPTLSVIGATLLLCDYIVTAALSMVEALHYFDVPGELVVPLSIAAIIVIGMVNWLGARSAGRFALVIAVVAIVASLLIAIACIPFVWPGLQKVTWNPPGIDSTWQRWESLVRIVLALSGIEAVANMTGLMSEPVAKTARRTIWIVLVEVLLLNMIFCLALNALPELINKTTPDYVHYELQGGLQPELVPEQVREFRDVAVRKLATEAGGKMLGESFGLIFGISTALVFGLLLMSAVNTAIMAMVSVQYSMARDSELPRPLTKLNYSGVPWIALVVACILPAGVLMFEADPKSLGELYAIGVVGAISISLFSVAANKKLEIRRWERAGLWSLAGLMTAIEATIIVAKPHATAFAAGLVGTALVVRVVLKARAASRAERVPEPAAGWMAELREKPIKLEPGRPRIMLAARGRDQGEYAVRLAKQRNAILFVIYVRTLRVLDVTPGSIPKLDDDRDAQEALGTVMVMGRDAGVPVIPIYVTSTEVPAEILDYTVTFGCDTLIMGKSRRSLFSRKVVGDVLGEVARQLPDEVSLITRSAGPLSDLSRAFQDEHEQVVKVIREPDEKDHNHDKS